MSLLQDAYNARRARDSARKQWSSVRAMQTRIEIFSLSLSLSLSLYIYIYRIYHMMSVHHIFGTRDTLRISIGFKRIVVFGEYFRSTCIGDADFFFFLSTANRNIY